MHVSWSWRRTNNLLLAAIILVNGYIIVAPTIPAVVFWWQSHHTQRRQELTHELRRQPAPDEGASAGTQANHVIIPSMLLDQPILEGPVRDTYSILDKGIWRWPDGSTPDKGSNTVLIGHRFTYTQPKGVFYYLNKVKLGDEIGVWWSGTRYLYKVSDIKEVPPTEVSIENPTPDARLTLFTCTPLWLPKDRLVVVAELETNS
jgi:sortase A